MPTPKVAALKLASVHEPFAVAACVSEALLALFKQAMTNQLEGAFGKVLEHQAKRK